MNIQGQQSPSLAHHFELISDDGAPTVPAHDAPSAVEAFHFAREIEQLQCGAQYLTAGHAARTLVGLASFRVVLCVLRRRIEVKQHHTTQPVSLQLLKGRIRVGLPDGHVEQAEGELVFIEQGVRHGVMALVDSAFLLSLPWGTA